MGDNGGWGWFAAVFLFFLLSGSATDGVLAGTLPDADARRK